MGQLVLPIYLCIKVHRSRMGQADGFQNEANNLRGAPSNNADLARLVASGGHGTPMRTPQSPGHGFTSRTPTMYAPASPGNFAPAARVAAGATTPSNPGFEGMHTLHGCNPTIP
eukprot:1160804-Pelagomonas_calceolata.AAC.32